MELVGFNNCWIRVNIGHCAFKILGFAQLSVIAKLNVIIEF